MVPAFKKGYSLLFGTTQFYVLLKLVATIYERLAKAESLIAVRSKEQCAEVGLDCEDIPSERFRMFVATLISSITQPPMSNRIDPSIYEDIARSIVGADAYLVFYFEKLITQVSSRFF